MTYSSDSEQTNELLKRVADGSPSALEHLLQLYRPYLERLISFRKTGEELTIWDSTGKLHCSHPEEVTMSVVYSLDEKWLFSGGGPWPGELRGKGGTCQCGMFREKFLNSSTSSSITQKWLLRWHCHLMGAGWAPATMREESLSMM